LARHLRNNAGSTLLEIVLTTLIMGFLAEVVAMNLLSQMPQRRLNGATSQIAWDFMGARMKAIKLRRNVTITFVDNHTYTIWIDANKNSVTDSGEQEVKNIHTKYHDVNFTSTNNVVFNSRGASNNISTITLTNSRGSKVIVIKISGFIKTI
jgi:Tfp pilus assembly protein FimT